MVVDATVTKNYQPAYHARNARNARYTSAVAASEFVTNDGNTPKALISLMQLTRVRRIVVRKFILESRPML